MSRYSLVLMDDETNSPRRAATWNLGRPCFFSRAAYLDASGEKGFAQGPHDDGCCGRQQAASDQPSNGRISAATPFFAEYGNSLVDFEYGRKLLR